uniref:Disintegrin domain-containing protein n=1 Tax=Syphacia muris TaxID=451379 RepID=A0A0N5ABP5_9BILA
LQKESTVKHFNNELLLQDFLYPECLYNSSAINNSDLSTCININRQCDNDIRCSQVKKSFIKNCHVRNGRCLLDDDGLLGCGKSMMSVKGTILETPCRCSPDDEPCLYYQSQFPIANPCVGELLLSFISNIAQHILYSQLCVNVFQELIITDVINKYILMCLKLSFNNFKIHTLHLKEYKLETGMKPVNPGFTKNDSNAPAKNQDHELKSTRRDMTENIFDQGDHLKFKFFKILDGCNLLLSTVLITSICFKTNLDWAGRCTKWCVCDSEKKFHCNELGCLKEGACIAPNITLGFGEQIYIKNRGACICHSGSFICELPEKTIVLGLYLLVGYSQTEIDILREKIPARNLEEAFYFSSDSLERNLAKALQNAFENYEDRCQFVVENGMKSGENIAYTVEWEGISRFSNDTRKKFHNGPDKCSLYVQRLAKMISRNEVPHSQLLLSTIKQIRVYDFLRGLPDGCSTISTSIIWQILLLKFVLKFVFNIY